MTVYLGDLVVWELLLVVLRRLEDVGLKCLVAYLSEDYLVFVAHEVAEVLCGVDV